MIKFFRRIRKQLLTENPPIGRAGKFSKYLLYAIGEIVLVMIGILLALQVNNWNEQRKIRKTSDTYRAKLIQDMVSDTLQINTLMIRGIKMQQGIEAYFEYFDGGNVSLDYLLDSARSVPNNYFRYFPSNHTFRDMQESGNTFLLSEEQRKALIELSNSQDFMTVIIDKGIEDIKVQSRERNMILDFDLSDSDFHTKISWQQDIYSKRRGLLYQHNILTDFHHLTVASNYRAERIKELTKKCLILLNKSEK